MSDKNDQIEKEIDNIQKKSKTNKLYYILFYIPWIISMILIGIFDPNMESIFLQGIFVFSLNGAIILTVLVMISNHFADNMSREIRSANMYADEKYKLKIKTLSFYNPKYKYESKFKQGLKLYILFAILTMIVYYYIFSSNDLFEILGQCLLVILFIMPFIYLMIKNYQKEKIKIGSLIETKLNISSLEKTIKPLYDSNLYNYLSDEYLFKFEKNAYVYSKKINDMISNNTRIYCDGVYDFNDCMMYIYNIFNYDFGEKSKMDIKEERTILFEFKNARILYEIEILNKELYNSDIDDIYDITIGKEFLTDKAKEILAEISENDVIDIYCNNGCVYIKKYVPKIIDNKDVEQYINNIELYKQFVDALM